jgi:hypothetical protein
MDSFESYSKQFQETSILPKKPKSVISPIQEAVVVENNNNNRENVVLTASESTIISEPPAKEFIQEAAITDPRPTLPTLSELHEAQKRAMKLFGPNTRSTSSVSTFKASELPLIHQNIKNQLKLNGSPSAKTDPTTNPVPVANLPAPKTFFIDSDSDDFEDSEMESLYSEDSSDEEAIAPPVFVKTDFPPIKRPSLLSVAIQRNEFKAKKQISPQCFEIGTTQIPESLQQNVDWDHKRPFNTTINTGINYKQYNMDPCFNYW